MAPQTTRKTQIDSKAKLDKWVTEGEGPMEKLAKESMRRQMEKMMGKMMEEMRESMKSYLGEYMEEIRKEREEERKREKEEWKKEKENIERRLEELERITERKEREDRKKNIVIKGVSWKRDRVEEEVSKVIKENLNVEVEVRKAYRIRIKEKDIVIASLDSWVQKREIMSKKRDLKQGIWIEDDLTKEEREVQRRLRERAREEREKGKKVKVGYMKLYIEDRIFRWNEKRRELEDRRRNE